MSKDSRKQKIRSEHPIIHDGTFISLVDSPSSFMELAEENLGFPLTSGSAVQMAVNMQVLAGRMMSGWGTFCLMCLTEILGSTKGESSKRFFRGGLYRCTSPDL